MFRYLIERTVPGAGQMDSTALAEMSAHSNAILAGMGTDIQWVRSYVGDDTITCEYLATSPELIYEHARCGNFPIDSVRAVQHVIVPLTAEATK